MELGYCFDHGIPHSQYLTWSEEDRNKVISWMIWQRSICPKCGTHPEEWYDEDGTYAEPPPYLAVDRSCGGCATLSEARAAVPKERREDVSIYLQRNVERRVPEWARVEPERT